MEFKASEALGRMRPSPTLAISGQARAMKREGKDVISLAAGEPDFPTPDHVIAAAKAAMDRGETHYTETDGIPELKAAIVDKFKRDNGLSFTPSQINVSAGGKAVIYFAMAASVSPGDEVLIPAPFWVSYPDVVRLVGGTPVFIDTHPRDGFRLTPEALEAAITPNTRWLILNSPSNPTGGIYSAEDLQAVAQVLRRHPHVWALSDDMYEHILFDGARFSTLAQVAPDLQTRILTMNGVSKAYAMTGWRIGYAGGPEDLIRGMAKVASQVTSNPCSISQWAAVAALTGPQDFIPERAQAFQARRDLVIEALKPAAGLVPFSPQGAFYLYVDCGAYLGRQTAGGRQIVSDTDFASALLEQEEVAVVPGSGFGMSPYFRASVATAETALRTACERIVRFCESLQAGAA